MGVRLSLALLHIYIVAEDLADVIKNNSSLEELYLYTNNLRLSVAVILKALKENSKFRVLSLSSNKLTEKVAEELTNFIKNNLSLEKLFLYNNEFKSCTVAILKALNCVKNLKMISLSNNCLTFNPLTKLTANELQSVINNKSITELWIGNNVLENRLLNICYNLKP